ncbi:hypothetical protein CVT24_009677 [Panaeolus cyanescens]|uniref:BTB domain-containing protein n=1 Tax=Panaeolus cyanescens TaxID=181874 RepID=A0A409Y9F1_9AGAR|nr:hypothetical protein CVT24_009677 [Panaeolus cyanescens]
MAQQKRGKSSASTGKKQAVAKNSLKKKHLSSIKSKNDDLREKLDQQTQLLYPTHRLFTADPKMDSPSLSPTPTLAAALPDAFDKRLILKHDVDRESITRHPRFYFPDGNVIFQIENTLFRVHRYFFQRDSPVFEGMFSLPPPLGEIPEGESEDRPIHLTGVSAKDFEKFLSILYPKDFSRSEITSVADWTSVLTIANQFDFSNLFQLAKTKLRPILSSAQSIALGKRFDVREWLIPAYTDLCIREEPLRLDEGQIMGLEDVIEIGRVRDLIRYPSNLNRHPDTIGYTVEHLFMKK